MRTGLLLTGFLVTGGWLMAQTSDRMTRAEYFEIFKDMAVHEMKRSGVPASITLAQGALESGDGNSSLARNANNHFGIKCHNDWTGKKVYQDDDARDECFRKYQSVEDSYRDHSDYLKTKQRYAFLFELDPSDYKGWARGLKKAGYATSPSYAEKLIQIIEEYDLDRYDRLDDSFQAARREKGSGHKTSVSRQILERNRVKYIQAVQGDTYESLTREFGKLDWELADYNDVQSADSLVPGQVIYIQPKRNKAETGKNVHIVKEGDTMYTISQLYAVKLSRLYAMNRMNPGTRPSVGTTLQLRKTLKGNVPEYGTGNEIPRGDEEQEEIKVELNLD